MGLKGLPGIRTIVPMFPDPDVIRKNQDRCKREQLLFIPGEVPSKKNNHRIKVDDRVGKMFVGPAALVKRYEQHSIIFYKQLTPVFKKLTTGQEYPLHIEFNFIRKDNQSWDYINIAQCVQDQMVQAMWIPDDNFRFLRPYFGDVIISKELYGVWIRILDRKNIGLKQACPFIT